MITDSPQRFRHYSGLSVQALLDLMRDLLDNLSKCSAPLAVDAFVTLDPAQATTEPEWVPTVEVCTCYQHQTANASACASRRRPPEPSHSQHTSVSLPLSVWSLAC
jgi:hypothetical protein